MKVEVQIIHIKRGSGLKATKQAHFMAYKKEKEKEKGNPYFVKVGQFSKDALGDWKCDMLVFSGNEVLFSLF